jgi:deazaflavin-dependent oxidoreductase (nitroreductase family)
MAELKDSEQRGDDYCYLTTTGRRSGHPHRIEIWYAARGDTLYLLSGGGRSSDWVQNLCANPTVAIELGGEDRPGRGRVVDTEEEAERARSLVFAKYVPRYDGDLTRWRNHALPVAVDLARPSDVDR